MKSPEGTEFLKQLIQPSAHHLGAGVRGAAGDWAGGASQLQGRAPPTRGPLPQALGSPWHPGTFPHVLLEFSPPLWGLNGEGKGETARRRLSNAKHMVGPSRALSPAPARLPPEEAAGESLGSQAPLASRPKSDSRHNSCAHSRHLGTRVGAGLVKLSPRHRQCRVFAPRTSESPSQQQTAGGDSRSF